MLYRLNKTARLKVLAFDFTLASLALIFLGWKGLVGYCAGEAAFAVGLKLAGLRLTSCE